MSRTQHGYTLTTPLRSGESELVYHHSGLIEGSITYKVDNGNVGTFNSYLGAAHPDDNNVILYAVRLKLGKAGLVTATFDCIGLSKDPTDRVISFPNSVNTEPIETHPRFVTHLAGVPDANGIGKIDDEDTGARFAVDGNGEAQNFLCFTDAAPSELRGVRSYYRGSIMCRSTYYTRQLPQMQEPCTISDPPNDVPAIAGITRWLHLVTSAEMVGKANLWRVTEEYISGTNNQISQLIYG